MTADLVGASDLAELEGLVAELGWPRARPLFIAVAAIDRRDRLRLVSHRDAQTRKIALAVLAGAGS